MQTEDRELIVVMRRCFAAKAELAAQLEAERKAAGAPIGMLYHPRQNADHDDLQRSHQIEGRDGVA
jgi:hypothetical protein